MVDLVDEADWIGLSAIALGELRAGFRGGSHRRRNEAELDEFLRHPLVEELRVDHDVARIYAEIVHALRAKGTPVPTNDVWIAATAARSGASVVTYDPHFAAMERVGVVLLGGG